MIRDPEKLAAFERALQRGDPPDHLRNLALAEAMRAEAETLGVWRRPDPMEGVAFKAGLVRRLHVL